MIAHSPTIIGAKGQTSKVTKGRFFDDSPNCLWRVDFPAKHLVFLHRPNETRLGKATVASVEPDLDCYEQYKIGCNCPYDIRYTYSDELETMGIKQLRTGRA